MSSRDEQTRNDIDQIIEILDQRVHEIGREPTRTFRRGVTRASLTIIKYAAVGARLVA